MTELTPAQIKRALNKSFKAFESIREGRIVLHILENGSFEATIGWSDANPSNHELIRREVLKKDFKELPEVIDFTSKLADAFPQSHIEITLEHEQLDLKINGTDALETSVNQFSNHMGPILKEWSEAPKHAYWIDDHGQMPVLPEDDPYQLRHYTYAGNVSMTFYKAPDLAAAIRRKALTEAKLGDRKTLSHFSKPETAAVMSKEEPLDELIKAYGNIKAPSKEKTDALNAVFEQPEIGHKNDGCSKMLLSQNGRMHRTSQSSINMHPDDMQKRQHTHDAWMDEIKLKIQRVFELYPNACVVAEATIDRGFGSVNLKVDHHIVHDTHNAHQALELIETIAPKTKPMKPFFIHVDDETKYYRRNGEHTLVCARTPVQALHVSEQGRNPVGALGQNPTLLLSKTTVMSCQPFTRDDIQKAWLATQD